MTYSYSSPLTYGQQDPTMYDGMTYKKPSSIPYAAGGLVLGAAAGGFAGSKINPFVSKDGKASDTFAKSVHDKVIETAADAEKNSYKQGQEILKQIDKISTPEELKNLADTNKEAMKNVCTELGQTPEEFLQNVTEENLSANKKTIKEKINAGNNTRYQDIKNKIQACWNKESKKFEKADSVKQEVFDAIKDSTKGVKGKLIAKYAAIAGAATGAAAFVAHKIFTNKNNV